MLRRSKPRLLAVAVFLVSAAGPTVGAADQEILDEIIVTADYRGRSVVELPGSATVLDAETIAASSVQHFEELIGLVPNLNWSGDGHRSRYLQIRGVGELEQYEGAPNPSVGFLVDDIDFSGIGTIATLFDIASVEVLRGSQGSRYGANALGGLIYVRSEAPTAERRGRLKLSAGGDGLWSLGAALGSAIGDDGRYTFRISAQHHESDGFRNNPYLGRDDTNGRKETTLRGRLRIEHAENLESNVALIFADIDDGYDAFALDNSLTMLSDKPGRDAQRSLGASWRTDWSPSPVATLVSITSVADSDIRFSFDADWGNPDSWSPVTYDYVSQSDRERRTLSQEIRLASGDAGRVFGDTTSWLAGLYAQRLDEELLTVNRGEYFDPGYDFADSLDDVFDSDYRATSVALFGRLDREIGAATRLGFGLRAERRSTDYFDSAGLETGPSETMWGGEFTLSHDVSDEITAFVSLSQGYKAGGFNLGPVPDGRRNFGEERLWTIETGIKAALADDTLRVNAAVFFSVRDDQQVRTSLQLVPGDPASFVFFTDNAATGRTLGLEADLRWLPADAWELYASLGLLDATFDEFVAPQGDISGRAQAHAPRYTLATGGSYRAASGFFARLDVSARDAFYFDVSHDQKSQAYAIVNGSAGYQRDGWTVTLWARNLLDERYAVRGFYFGNEPPDFLNALYTRAGDPRQLGITIEKRFE